MQWLPREILRRLAGLPDGQPCKVILNFDGHGGVVIETFEREEIRVPLAPLLLEPFAKEAVLDKRENSLR